MKNRKKNVVDFWSSSVWAEREVRTQMPIEDVAFILYTFTHTKNRRENSM